MTRVSFSRRAERGAALIIVLALSLGLVGLALLFGNAMMLEFRSTDHALAGKQAEQAIEAARRYVAYVLRDVAEPGMMPDINEYQSEEVRVGEGAFWLIGRGDDETTHTRPVCGLLPEAAKLNLNTAPIEILELLPGMTAELAAAIIDWRDSDNEVSPDGAESQSYLLRDPPYLCKDAPFESLEELHLVIGADWSVLYGEDYNRNGVLEPCEDDGDESPPPDDRDGRLDFGVLEYLTVYSREPNLQTDGTQRVNVNENRDELRQVFEENFGQERAAELLAQAGPANYTSVLQFILRTGMTLEEAARVSDALTVSNQAYLLGLVNVNVAPAAVLACLPGVGQDRAAELVAYRLGKTTELESVAWVGQVLSEEEAMVAGPYLTTRSYQFTADVAAVGHRGLGYRRVQFVFDTTEGEPRVFYRRDLTRLGWALGDEIRQEQKDIDRQEAPFL